MKVKRSSGIDVNEAKQIMCRYSKDWVFMPVLLYSSNKFNWTLVTAGLRKSVYSVGASDVVLRLVRPLESYP
jgi:hypothetical protein